MTQLDMFNGNADLMRFAAESKWSEIFNLRTSHPRLYAPMLTLRVHARALNKALTRIEKSKEWEDDHRRALKSKEYHAYYAARSLRAVVKLI